MSRARAEQETTAQRRLRPDTEESDMATKAIVGEKVGMTQVWDDDNRVVPVTVLKVAPPRIVQVKTHRTRRLQRPAGDVRPQGRQARPSRERGHFAKADVQPGVRLVELRLEDVDGYAVGHEIKADVLEKGERIDVTAVSQGQGLRRRHEAAQLQGSGREPRQPQAPPGPWRDRCLRLSRPGVQGDADGRTPRPRAGDDAEPGGRVGRSPSASSLLVRGSVPGPKGGVVIVRDAVKAPRKGGQ